MSAKRAKQLRRVLRDHIDGGVEVVDVTDQSIIQLERTALNPVGIRFFKGSFRRPNIMACLPSADGKIPLEVHLALLRLAAPLNGTIDYVCLAQCEVGVARNMFVERARGLRDKPDYVLFIGDDMLPPFDGMLRLWEEAERNKWDVLGGLYHWKGEPAVPLCWAENELGYPDESKWTENQVVPCDVCGMDFTLIRLSIIEKLGEPPWWRTSVIQDPSDGGIVSMTEDSFFCRKVKDVGGMIAVHTGVRVGHLDVKSGRIY